MKQTVVRKWIAFCLAVCMGVSLCCIAPAETVRLPEGLRVIEAEAFEGTSSLDVVSVPDGADTIRSLAFANSMIRKIYLPDSMTSIADDAFDNTDVTICSTADAFAREYAETHRIPWECSYGDTDDPGELEDLEPLENEGEIPYLSYMSTDGVSDPDEVELIQNYNQFVYNYNTGNGYQYWSGLYDLKSHMRYDYNLPGEMSEISLEESGNQLNVMIYGESFQLDRELFEGQKNVSTGVAYSDGSDFILKDSGASYGTARDELPSAADSDFGINTQWLEKCQNQMNAISNWYNTIIQTIEKQLVSLEGGITDLTDIIRDIEKAPNSSAARSMLKQLRGNLATSKSARVLLRSALGTLSKLNIVAAVANVAVCIKRLSEIKEIGDHWHPNDNDRQSEAGLAIAQKMVQELGQLAGLYTTDLVLTITGCLSFIASAVTRTCSVLSLAAPPAAAALAAASTVTAVYSIAAAATGTFISLKEEQLYESVIAAHKKLHTHVFGWVNHRANQTGLNDVIVSCNGVSTTTGSYNSLRGYYELYLPEMADGETVTLLFRKDGYFSESEFDTISKSVTLIQGEGVELNAEVGEPFYVEGKVIEKYQNTALSNVKITDGESTAYSDNEGKFKIYTTHDSVLTFSVDNHEPIQRSNFYSSNGLGGYKGENFYLTAEMLIIDWGSAELIGFIRPARSDSGAIPSITCDGQTVHPDSKGWFRISVSNGSTVIATCPGLHTQKITYTYGRVIRSNSYAQYGQTGEDIDFDLNLDWGFD